MIRNRIQLVWQVLIIALFVALAGAGAVYADDAAPAAGDPPTENVGESTDTIPTSYMIYLSAPGNGNVGGVAYADEDVVRYSSTTNTWAIHFDGSAAGLPATADIDAYEYDYNPTTFTHRHYMSFVDPVNIPGLGKVDDSDVVLYSANWLGNTWSLHFDGSAYGLTTAGEDMDALFIGSNEDIFLSTNGPFVVPVSGSIAEQNGNDEDTLGLIKGHTTFHYFSDGNEMGIGDGNDLNNYAHGLGHAFYNLAKPANFNGLTVDANDVIIRTGSYGAWQYALFFDNGAKGFPKIDALDVE